MNKYIVKLKNVEKPIYVVANRVEINSTQAVFYACRRAIKNKNELCDTWFMVCLLPYDAIEGKIEVGEYVPLSDLEQENDDRTVEAFEEARIKAADESICSHENCCYLYRRCPAR
jgi:hypothetical protein